ncbi:MAG: hypothetical protein GWP10_10470 [Nitrospiraceae bacterium]|nr:hypothetical protein [Nitrospiraceae bacterium]
MKKEARLLLDKAIDSLIIGIEHFNRPSDRGRVSTVLIMLDHAFEMLLKAAILHRGGRIREKRMPQTIGFDACVRKALSNGKIKFLTEEQALQLQAINGFRDAAQHHLLDISEQHLYMQTQGGLTIFRDILLTVFNKDLKAELPKRVLPVSTTPPTDLSSLFENDVEEVRQLFQPGRRRRIEAKAKLRALAILDGAMRGERLQPSRGELNKLGQAIAEGKKWEEIFPGVASIDMTATGDGPNINLRITKKEGIPIQLVPKGTPGASVVAVKRVNELGYYCLGRNNVAEKIGLSPNRTTAVIWFLKLKSDKEYFKEFRIGRMKVGRYSLKAVDKIQKAIQEHDIDEIWRQYQAHLQRRRNARKNKQREF